MSIILTKVINTSRYELDKPDVPQLASFGCGIYSLYLPMDVGITGRLRLIREYTRRGYKLNKIGYKACFAGFTKQQERYHRRLRYFREVLVCAYSYKAPRLYLPTFPTQYLAVSNLPANPLFLLLTSSERILLWLVISCLLFVGGFSAYFSITQPRSGYIFQSLRLQFLGVDIRADCDNIGRSFDK